MAKFEFGTPEKRRRVAVAKKTPREKYIDSLNEQKRAFDIMARGQEPVRKNKKRIRPRWFEANPGEFWIGLYYGNRPFQHNKKPALKVGEQKDIPAALDFLIKQAENGEFDKAIEAIASAMSKQRLGRRRK